eukprot:74836-Chlamydomonas_euryale.AAC.1
MQRPHRSKMCYPHKSHAARPLSCPPPSNPPHHSMAAFKSPELPPLALWFSLPASQPHPHLLHRVPVLAQPHSQLAHSPARYAHSHTRTLARQ